jgi:hypothetical protein
MKTLTFIAAMLCFLSIFGAANAQGLCDRGELRQNLGLCVSVSASASEDRTASDHAWTQAAQAVQDDRAMPSVYTCIDNALAERLSTLSLFGYVSPVDRSWPLTISPIAMRKCNALNIATSQIPKIPRAFMARFLCSETWMILESRVGEAPNQMAARAVQACTSIFVL